MLYIIFVYVGIPDNKPIFLSSLPFSRISLPLSPKRSDKKKNEVLGATLDLMKNKEITIHRNTCIGYFGSIIGTTFWEVNGEK